MAWKSVDLPTLARPTWSHGQTIVGEKTKEEGRMERGTGGSFK